MRVLISLPKDIIGFLIWLLAMLLTQAACGQVKAVVTRVVDGDTYVLRMDGRTVTARLTQIDAPELNQAYGLEARFYVRELLEGKPVRCFELGTDRYGRELVDLTDPGGQSIAALIVSNGWAWVHPSYAQDDKLGPLQMDAANSKRGLWACGVERVCPPWLFRGYNWRNKFRYCRGCRLRNPPYIQ